MPPQEFLLAGNRYILFGKGYPQETRLVLKEGEQWEAKIINSHEGIFSRPRVF
jgi:hypothetical protein